MNFKGVNHNKDLSHYYHSGRYQAIAGGTMFMCIIITWALTALTVNTNFLFLILYIIWSLFTIIFPEVEYLSYAAKDKLYYLYTQRYDGDLLGSVCDGVSFSVIVQFYYSTLLILGIDLIVNPCFFLICPLIMLFPFIFVCSHVTSIKTKIKCFFKYLFVYDVILMYNVHFVIIIIMLIIKALKR